MNTTMPFFHHHYNNVSVFSGEMEDNAIGRTGKSHCWRGLTSFTMNLFSCNNDIRVGSFNV